MRDRDESPLARHWVRGESSGVRVHQTVIVGLGIAVLLSIWLPQPAGTDRVMALGLAAAAVAIAFVLGTARGWAAWRATGGITAAVLLAALFAVTGGTETIYQDALAAVMVVSALTLPLRLVVVNSLAATFAAGSAWLYDPAFDGVFAADLVADVGVWLAITVGVYLQTRMLRIQAHRLEQSEQVRLAFLRGTSHELRTPLNAVAGFAETLQRFDDRLTDEQRRTITGRLLSNTDRLSALIEDLLDVDRLSSGLIEANRVPHDLVGLIRRVVDDGVPQDRRVEFDLEPTVASLDVAKIERVVHNLVANAHRHSPPGGAIRIELVTAGDDVVLSVRDQGPGIAEGYAERIFEPFVQGPERVDAAQPGTGLGLALVRELVGLHGGSVSAANMASGGAIFEVRLPSDLGIGVPAVDTTSTA